jgi:ketosteroid isomerase-like protein
VGVSVSGEQFLANQRFLFALPTGRFSHQVLATRGERLGLSRTRFTGRTGSDGEIDVPMLSIAEVDEDARYVRLVLFEPDRFDGAYAELDRSYRRREAAGHLHASTTMPAFLAAFERRDWDALGALFAENVLVQDHRRLGWETLPSRAAYVAAMRSLVELSPDVGLRLDHVRASARHLLWVASWTGTHEGGAFEAPWVIVSEHDADGMVRRFDQYDVEQLDAALARFAELAGARVSENASTRIAQRIVAAVARQDWSAVEAMLAERLTFEDRRRGVLLAGDRALLLQNLRFLASPAVRCTATPLSVFGDRIAIHRFEFRAADAAAPFEVESLQVDEVGADGRLVASIVFEPGDRAGAWAEARRRAAGAAS